MGVTTGVAVQFGGVVVVVAGCENPHVWDENQKIRLAFQPHSALVAGIEHTGFLFFARTGFDGHGDIVHLVFNCF